ncbi:MAG: YggS family pyridoxal phosphate-dependent enzyme [Verrucomicrobiota bacterium]
MNSFEDFIKNHESIQARVALACEKAGRDRSMVTVMPVTKTHPADAIEYAVKAGYRSVGENRVQEAIDKMPQSVPCDWELIGHLQSNKAKDAVKHFCRIQSVDSEKLIRRLNAAAEQQSKTMRILLQINAGEDPAKFGATCEAADPLVELALNLTNIRLEGLMTIAPLSDDPTIARRCFERLRTTRDRLQERFQTALPELSMGMSGDLESAIVEGSTVVRLGSAFYGERALF